ncbi:MAG TPA: ribosomal protein S18-alanine N-acetyltransferase [Firmicutes bacterium]|nr:ribosomal protein S18-alanine N-acetyltransferase [Bacillota bacterium]
MKPRNDQEPADLCLPEARSAIADSPPEKNGGDIRILPMEPAHLDQVAAIERLCFTSTAWSRETFAKGLTSPQYPAFCAMDGACVAGYICLSVLFEEINIDNIATAPSYRRRGIGQALLLHAIGYAGQVGGALMTLEVRSSNEAARRLYQKFGFFEVGRRKNYYTHPREDAILMNLEL